MGFVDPIPGSPPGIATEEEEAALARLRPLVAPECAPVLSDAELLRIIRESRKWNVWAISTRYAVGDTVSPSPFTGLSFECVHAGVSGAAQPDALSVGSEELLLAYGRIPDNDAIWQFKGKISGSPFDLRRAAHACWIEKAALTTREHDFSPGGNRRFDRKSIHDHCMRMAARFAPIRIR